ncbi:tetratricopeptide repeat protein [Asticcacaulis sp.]|uniref:tetratricopeptide repeat protein n=1 Tax=Asticcacaulis sp. TaxID=1872648 RepID=UPI002C684A0A|nr:tetratricopeptide repeat protein [Asticcacaulis sp.]HTM82118.1 tetratricopeptide repeat protein [Asticcacaulis sp.]
MFTSMRSVWRKAAGVAALAFMLAPMTGHAEWNAANDEANRQRMMSDMRSNAAAADRRSFESQQRSSSGYTSRTDSGASYSGASSGGGYQYKPYEYVPQGPKSVVATYYFTVRVQETEGQTIARLQSEAAGGNAQSQFDLGRVYYTGYGVPADNMQARKWFCEAAKQDHPIAKSQCAGMMYNGQGGPEDTAQAMLYLKEAASKGDPYGQALYGFFTLAEAAHRGEVDAPLPEAIAYLVKAADQGQLVAQATLGTVVYFYGTNGAAQDVPRAVGYIRLAAAQNDPLSMDMLGMMYVSGANGVERNPAEGVRLLKAAAAAGKADAAGVLAILISADDFGMRDDAAAFAYAQQAARGGDKQGQVVLAKFYYFGQGTDKNIVEAARWFTAAAAQGDPESMEALKEADLAEAAKQL